MAFFDPSKPIILRTEASFNEGLSAACSKRQTEAYNWYISSAGQ